MEMEKKRNRGKNFSEREKQLLLDLVRQNLDVIENKITNAVSNKLKNDCWEKICCSFNAQQDSGSRNAEQLKNLYDCLKRKARKEKSQERVMIYKTGGGPSEHQKINSISEVVLDLIADQVSPIPCEFDSDSGYHKDPVPEEMPVNSNLINVDPVTIVDSVIEVVDGESSLTLINTSTSKSKVSPPKHRKQKRSINDVYENLHIMATSQTNKNKAKERQMCKVNDIKLSIQETELKIKEEELKAKRKKYASDEEESKLRKELLRVELEIAKSKLGEIKNNAK